MPMNSVVKQLANIPSCLLHHQFHPEFISFSVSKQLTKIAVSLQSQLSDHPETSLHWPFPQFFFFFQ